MTIKPTKHFGAYIAIFSIITILITVSLVKYYPAKYVWTTDKKEIEWGVKSNIKKDSLDNSFDAVSLKLETTDYDWQKSNKQVADQVNAITAKKRAPVVNIYPQFLFNEAIGTAAKIFNQPEYLQVMNNICLSLVSSNSSDQPIFINFAPSPDGIKAVKSPWITPDAGSYVAMYEKFTEICRQENADNKQLFVFVWSPAVLGDFRQYKPLDKSFDIIGLNVYSDERDPSTPNSVATLNYSFKNVFDPQYDSIKSMRRNVMVFMGVSGREAYKNEWVSKALTNITDLNIQRYLKFVVYDNEPRLIIDTTKNYTISPKVYPFKVSLLETENSTISSTISTNLSTTSPASSIDQVLDTTNQTN